MSFNLKFSSIFEDKYHFGYFFAYILGINLLFNICSSKTKRNPWESLPLANSRPFVWNSDLGNCKTDLIWRKSEEGFKLCWPLIAHELPTPGPGWSSGRARWVSGVPAVFFTAQAVSILMLVFLFDWFSSSRGKLALNLKLFEKWLLDKSLLCRQLCFFLSKWSILTVFAFWMT